MNKPTLTCCDLCTVSPHWLRHASTLRLHTDINVHVCHSALCPAPLSRESLTIQSRTGWLWMDTCPHCWSFGGELQFLCVLKTQAHICNCALHGNHYHDVALNVLTLGGSTVMLFTPHCSLPVSLPCFMCATEWNTVIIFLERESENICYYPHL